VFSHSCLFSSRYTLKPTFFVPGSLNFANADISALNGDCVDSYPIGTFQFHACPFGQLSGGAPPFSAGVTVARALHIAGCGRCQFCRRPNPDAGFVVRLQVNQQINTKVKKTQGTTFGVIL
jgi:hypothetical protein